MEVERADKETIIAILNAHRIASTHITSSIIDRPSGRDGYVNTSRQRLFLDCGGKSSKRDMEESSRGRQELSSGKEPFIEHLAARNMPLCANLIDLLIGIPQTIIVRIFKYVKDPLAASMSEEDHVIFI